MGRIMGRKQKTTLLVVDPETQVCRALVRVLRRHFDAVVAAADLEEARAALAAHPVTHLLCDEDLVSSLPDGLALIANWRAVRPSIQRAVVLSGSDSGVQDLPAGVDGVLNKSSGRDEILSGLDTLPPPPAGD